MPKPFIERKNNAVLDAQELENQGYTDIHFQGIHLTGGTESNKPYNECFFGELDSKDSNMGFNTSKPIYHLISNEDLSNTDSPSPHNNTTAPIGNATLQVFLNNFTLTILHYSLIHSSLHIKLECNSSESKEIEDKEKALLESKAKDSKENKESISTAFLCPVLEDNELKCPHNGIVQLKSKKGKSFKSKGIPMILESDLLNASIVGCTNNIAGVPTPCTLVSVILPSSRALKKFNDDYPIMQDLCASGVLSDKGFPITCKPKNNTFKINAPNPSNTKEISKEALASAIKLTKPSIRLYYKEHNSQQDNLPINKLYCNGNLKEQEEPFTSLTFDFKTDTIDIADKDLESLLTQRYSHKEYILRQMNLQLGNIQIQLIFIIPQFLPKVFKVAYKEYEYKDYGVGRYTQLLEYSKDIKEDKESTAKDTSSKSIFIKYTRVFLSSYKANKLDFTFALGLDSWLEKENITEFKIVSGKIYEKAI